jgi:hypothetical protein
MPASSSARHAGQREEDVIQGGAAQREVSDPQPVSASRAATSGRMPGWPTVTGTTTRKNPLPVRAQELGSDSATTAWRRLDQ